MAAFFGPVVIYEVVVRPMVVLARTGTHRGRRGRIHSSVEVELRRPLEASGGHPRVRQPVERDVVDNVVTCQCAR